MDAIKMLKERRSVRKFKNQKVDRELIKELVSTSTFAPTWANTQTARYNIIDDKETQAKLAECMNGFAFNQKTSARSAGVVVISAVKGLSGYSPTGEIDTKKGDTWKFFDAGIAAQTFCLAAHEKGLGTVILGIFDEDEVAEVINLPENEVVECLIPYGYPESDETKPAPKRLSVDEVIRFV